MNFMRKVNLLKSIKKIKRDIDQRKAQKNRKIIKTAKIFGKSYFDGDRKYGYGGYYYDGRWKSVVKRFIKFYNLKKKDKILDIGCAKGFLVKDFIDKGIDAYGIDISRYALSEAPKQIKKKVFLGNAKRIPFNDNTFKLVISINTLHNLNKNDFKVALKEINRVSNKFCFIQIDAYRNEKEKKLFLNWVLTAKTHMFTKDWVKFLRKQNYKGDYFWTFV